jgi:hypothetical protein
MTWAKVRRDDSFQGSNEPFISVSRGHVSFNAMFVRQAGISPSKRVTICVDEEERKLGFEFHDDAPDDSFALTRASGDKIGTKRQGLNCTASGLAAKYDWISSVARLPPKDRRFYPRKEGNLWVIVLRPSFEHRRARESADIPSDVSGIYRYLRETGEVVYIGRGNVKKRLQAPERADWDFDVIEYSAILDPDRQVEWEDYWLERFKEDNNGKLPFYNKQSGESPKKDSGG